MHHHISIVDTGALKTEADRQTDRDWLTDGEADAEGDICNGVDAAVDRDMSEVDQVAHVRHHGRVNHSYKRPNNKQPTLAVDMTVDWLSCHCHSHLLSVTSAAWFCAADSACDEARAHLGNTSQY